MNILLLGGGGREHALAWKLAQSPLLGKLHAAPGNPGIADHAQCHALDMTDHAAVTAFCNDHGVDLVVIGPEAPLVDGLADSLRGAGVSVFGPSQAAAQLEGSKGFTKDLCLRAGIPTAGYVRATSEVEALAALDSFGLPVVIKADGLAAGKGVVIAETADEAREAIIDMFGGHFGSAGAEVVIEEFMTGEEVSLFALADGKTSILFGAAQDHKRAYDGDKGPNTGGMGTYSPAPILTPMLTEQARLALIEPTVKGIAAEGAPYRGVLYAGLMLTPAGAKLVEYNARFGDPECQVLMLRLKSDLVPYLLASATGNLADMPEPAWRNEAAICVVLAAEGYPEAPKAGTVITGADADFGPDVVVFHAGTARDDQGRLVAAGGRVLNVCARGADLAEARAKAYAAIGQIDWPEGFHRTDIGWRALAR